MPLIRQPPVARRKFKNLRMPGERIVQGYFYQGNPNVNVDYSNRMVAVPLESTEDEPFQEGFYYLHVEVDSSDPRNCMIHPPASQCNEPIGQQATKSFTTIDRLYKHWDSPPYEYPGSNIHSSNVKSLVVRSDKKYLITWSVCQLQIREHPRNSNGGNLPIAPTSNFVLCP